MSIIHIYSKRMDQPSKVANPARGQLNREIIFPCPRAYLRIWSREVMDQPSKVANPARGQLNRKNE